MIGRDTTIHALYKSLVRANHPCRYLNIVGNAGVGKAALVTALGEYECATLLRCAAEMAGPTPAGFSPYDLPLLSNGLPDKLAR